MVAVDNPAVVVACAVEAAVTLECGGSVVCANLLRGGPEIVDGVLLGSLDLTGGDQDVVDTNGLARVGKVECVVVNGSC